MNPTTWQPLLTGDLLAQAREALAEITESLRAGAAAATAATQEYWPREAAPIREACLSSGRAGQAIYFAYLHQANGEQWAADFGLELLDQAIEAANAERMSPSLYAGFPGIVWTANHLSGRLYAPDGEDPYAETDEILRDYVARLRWPFPFDLISGPVGAGVHALERLPRPSARRCLETIVDRLDEVAQRGAAGIAWPTPPELLIDERRAECPGGMHDLGLAHGVPGVVALLGAAWAADVARDRAGPLLAGAVPWLLAQELAPGSLSRFPKWRAAGQEAEPSRLAWCYGDPGVAAALMAAAAALGRDDWRQEALATALVAARRPPENSGVRDASLCHGSAGLAHIFNRLYQATGEAELGRAALRWYEQLLLGRTPDQGQGGYLFDLRTKETTIRVPDFGFLNGTAGIGLALLAATSTVEPAWDRALLTSIPPRDAG